MKVYELNMDGLVGPTHHYAGLSEGNIASTQNALSVANPKAAALQGLKKMRLLHNMGIKQALLPPHARPNLHLLHKLGFTGTPKEQITKASQAAPELLSACYSASSMWTANAATVSASNDCADNCVHFTAANLISNLHRHQEADFSKQILERIFHDDNHFKHHFILPSSLVTADEGAANHNRLCKNHSEPGISLFVYGKEGLHSTGLGPRKYPARQTLEASLALARQHLLSPEQVVFAHQHPNAIDSGVFHNDVISVVNESVFFAHEQAFIHQPGLIESLKQKADFDIHYIEISTKRLSLEDTVKSYLFNSQLITTPDGNMVLIAPSECETNSQVKSVIDELLEDASNPITKAYYLDLKQSMRNGGGPACLRLRVPLKESELNAMHQGVLVNDNLLDTLESWVAKHYRGSLHANDLADPSLIDEVMHALDELTQCLNLGSLYSFQR